MKMILYKNNSDLNVIEKDLTKLGESEIFLKKDFNISSPTLYLKTFIDECNYLFFPYLNRYYAMTNKVKSSLWKIELETDVLMTFKEVIYNSTIELNKTDNANYFDGSLNFDVRTETLKYESDIEVEEKETTILVTVGG